MIPAETRSAIEKALGEPVASMRPVSGGDISAAYLLEGRTGQRTFLKVNPNVPRDFFLAEARGLDWLRSFCPLRIPEVIAVGSDPAFLVLEYLDSGSRQANFEETLGQGLATLHQAECSYFGLDHDNYIGRLPQVNSQTQSWAEFYLERRLKPQVRQAIESGRAPKAWSGRFRRLYKALPALVPDEPPARLHGDLWGGNLLTGPQGEPCLIDPAVYGGHREVDLAMMKLFGGFGPKVFAAYQERFPLTEGFESRVSLYQLYPLLVHVNLFGDGYVGSVERALSTLP